MNLTVLCMACNTPLLTTTPERLGWPLHGNMFSMLMPNWTLRDMPLYLEYWCPVCHNFPFYADGTETGYKGVGRYLNVMVDGRPQMMSVEQIKNLSGGDFREPEPLISERISTGAVDGQAATPGEKPALFPCPDCGAKKRFHRTGCSVKKAPADPFIETLERRVKKGGFNEDANLPPTPEEIAELARDREVRSNGRTEPQLRAME